MSKSEIDGVFEISKNAKTNDLFDVVTLKLDQAKAMALVVGSEGFGDWTDSVRSSYGSGLAELIEIADRAVMELARRHPSGR